MESLNILSKIWGLRMDKNSFVFNYSYLEKLKNFTDQEFRNIITAIVYYDRDGEIITLTDREQLAFDMIIPDIIENRNKYIEKCEKNRQKVIDRWEREKHLKK